MSSRRIPILLVNDESVTWAPSRSIFIRNGRTWLGLIFFDVTFGAHFCSLFAIIWILTSNSWRYSCYSRASYLRQWNWCHRSDCLYRSTSNAASQVVREARFSRSTGFCFDKKSWLFHRVYYRHSIRGKFCSVVALFLEWGSVWA